MKRWAPAAAATLITVTAAVTGAAAPPGRAAPAGPGSGGTADGAVEQRTDPGSGYAPARAYPDPDTVVREAVDALGPHAGRLTVAVEDLRTGTSALYGGGTGTYDTASIVKVDILTTLLLQAQGRGTGLTPAERKLAGRMIRYSDNDATDVLWKSVGGTAGLDAANDALGLSGTTAGPGARWGLTRTTAAGQLELLTAVFGDDSPLSASSRAYLRTLMGAVTPSQAWGVTAAGDPRAPAAELKNGWLKRTATGLWDINSIGRVRFGDHTLLVAVLSDGQPGREAGIGLVERTATAAVHALVQNTSY